MSTFCSKTWNKKWDFHMRNRCYFPLLFRGNILHNCVYNLQKFPYPPLIKGHCIQCNAYTLKLTFTTNLSRLSHVTIKVTFLLINKSFLMQYWLFFIEFYKYFWPSTAKANRFAATLLLKTRDISRFKK